MTENTEHYVYIYNDPKTGEAIYVGKGKEWRAHSHKNWSTNSRLKNLIGKRQLEGFQVEPEIIAEGSEENMLLIEVALIKLYGRQDLATGTLLNSTDGGDGVRNPSEEVRAKQRAAAFRRYGGERIFDFEKPETGETFQGNMPDFAKFLGNLLEIFFITDLKLE